VTKTSRKQNKSRMRKNKRRRIFIVEDNPVFRAGLVQVVNREQDLEVCGQAGDSEVAFKEIIQQQPDLVLVDISFPGKSGFALIKELRAVSRKIKLLVISIPNKAFYATRCSVREGTATS